MLSDIEKNSRGKGDAMKKLLFIKDPEHEVGFDILCDYCATIQDRLGEEVAVIPIWPTGEVELIGDKRKLKLHVKNLKEMLEELEIELNN